MALQIYQWFQAHLNYWTITLLMTIESSFIPFPSEIVVPPAAYFAMQEGSNLNIFLVILFATIGAFLGATINYYLALWVGRPIVYKFANSRLGHMCLIDAEKVETAEKYFDKQLCFMNRKISYKCKKGDYAKNKANEKQRKGD